ncbi:uncharacterized protein LOC111688380 [Lucilia cuprina]|uniref:uncharacterized protein LOC111688380 n=1 Tax=Lucilia cuprina TaxID=7375 RepID=UPI001F06F023|nr:uncharacterized protein LOC111688380 [Lucilia cuprina]
MSKENNISVKFLIHLVGERPALWDKTSEEYKDRALKETSWREICTFVNENYERMQPKAKQEFTRMITRKWTHIRDSWVKSMKYGYDEETKLPPKPYIYHNELKFMQKILKCKPPRYNLNMSQLSNMHFEEFYRNKNDNNETNEVDNNNEQEEDEDGEVLKTGNLKQEHNHIHENEQYVANEADNDDEAEEDDWPLDDPEVDIEIEEKKLNVKPVTKTRTSIFKSSRNEDEYVPPPVVVSRPTSTSSAPSKNGFTDLYQNRHWNFFQGILPSVNDLDEDHVLQFQSGVIVLLQKLRESQKYQRKPTNRVPSHSLFKGRGRKRKASNDNDYDWPVHNMEVVTRHSRRSTGRSKADPIAAEDMDSQFEYSSDN